MPRERKRTKRWVYFVWFALIFPLFLYLVSFWGDLSRVLSYIGQFFYWSLFGRDQPLPTPAPVVLNSFEIMAFTILVGFIGSFLLWLLLMSFQAILPVETLDEVIETLSHTITYIMRSHGPAIFVLDGKIESSAEEIARPGPGVIVVNFNSAIVLEYLLGRGSCLMLPATLLNRLVQRLMHTPPAPAVRVAGPGVVFSMPNERIRAVVDLRKQSRFKPKISAYTRDGIEITSNIFSVFTIGQRPDVIELAYQGERRIENLKIISTRRVGRNLVEVKTVPGEELNPADLAQVQEYARIPNQHRDALKYNEVENPRPEPEFDEKRVFSAVYAQARNPQEQVIPWTELPVQVATDLYRSLMSHINYDEFYNLGNPSPTAFAIPDFKRRFKIMLRNTGLLWFRVVEHRSLVPLKDGTYSESDLFVSPYQTFTSSQVLRDRGIKVLAAGFSSPIPSEEVYKQRLASWRAEWEHDTELKRAQKDLEALRIRNHARAQAQYDLTQALSAIFERDAGSDEVMALRVFQALEGVAADPKTNQLLPGDTINLLKNLHDWLLPGEVARTAASNLLPPRSSGPAPEQPPQPGGGLPPDFEPPDHIPPPPATGGSGSTETRS